MKTTLLANLSSNLQAAGRFLADPVANTRWDQWREFWLAQIFDERFVVLWFLPLLPLLLLTAGRNLRLAIVATGLIFLGYTFGVAYAGFWLLNAIAFYYLAEWFARECRRTDIWPKAPVVGATLIVGGWHVVTMLLHEIELPGSVTAWLYTHARWIFPLGTRGLTWEPRFDLMYEEAVDGPPQLFYAIFWNIHNIGTAYFTVRMLHYFSEIKRDHLPAQRRTLLNFLSWICYAPNLIQGPIERFEPFHDEIDTCHQRRSWDNVLPALYRISLGIAKSLAMTLWTLPFLREVMRLGTDANYYKTPQQIDSTFVLYVGVAVHLTWLYLGFSGYCDVSAGLARLLGYRQIENFNKPWLATSLRDMWRRWHISLSFILRDYVYIALGGNRRHVVLNLCVTFFLCGIWHWLMVKVGVWGLVMGLMVAVNHLWVQWMKRLDEQPHVGLGRLRQRWLRWHPLPTICAWLITQHAFMWSILVLFGGGAIYRVPLELLRRFWMWLT